MAGCDRVRRPRTHHLSILNLNFASTLSTIPTMTERTGPFVESEDLAGAGAFVEDEDRLAEPAPTESTAMR